MTKINSPIADEAKNLTKGGKDYSQEAWDNIHDDLMQGYYNRKYDSIRYPEPYNPEDYGFRIQPEIGFGVPVEEQLSREDWEAAMKDWKDPLVEDLLNNYDWDKNHVKSMMQIKTLEGNWGDYSYQFWITPEGDGYRADGADRPGV